MMKFKLTLMLLALAVVLAPGQIAYGQSSILGDLNGDSLINVVDRQLLSEAIVSGSSDPAADLNRDGVVDFADLGPLFRLQQFALGDGNEDGAVTFADIPLFIAAQSNYNRQFDFDGDGDVDSDDLSSFQAALSGTAQLSIVGDLNGDRLINDADRLLLPLSAASTFADINQDGVFNGLDLVPFFDLLDYSLGDGNRDGAVDFLDIDFFIDTLSAGPYDRQFDFDGDGDVDFQDIPLFIAVLDNQ